jgi:hypothetical protein
MGNYVLEALLVPATPLFNFLKIPAEPAFALTVYRKLLLDQPLEDFASEGFSGILYAVIFTHWFVFATSLLNYTSSFHIFSFFSSPYLIEQFHDFSSSNGFSSNDLRFFECKGIFSVSSTKRFHPN